MRPSKFLNLLTLALLTFVSIVTLPAEAAETGRASRTRRSIITERELRDLNHEPFYNFIGVQGSVGLAHAGVGTPQGVQVDTGMRVRPMFGAYYERRLIPYLGLRAEFDYAQRGFTINQDNNQSRDFLVGFLEFPLLVKAQVELGGFVTPFIAAGPFLGVAVSKSQTLNTGGGAQGGFNNNGNNAASQDMGDQSKTINTVNFGFNFGAGVSFEVVRHFNIEIGARYSLGLLNMLSKAASDNALAESPVQVPQGSEITVRLSDVQFLGGVSFSI